MPGRPARTGRFALWEPGRTPATFTDALDVVLPAGDSVRQRTVPVTYVDLIDVLDALVELAPDAPCGASVHGWAVAARSALHLIARGRLLPAVDEDGIDGWRIGPLDPADLEARDGAADALPPTAHATALPGTAPRRVSSPRWLVARFWDAIADAYVRTAAAALVSGQEAFAVRERVALVPARGEVVRSEASVLGMELASATWGGSASVPSWLQSTSSSAEADITVALRLDDAGTHATDPQHAAPVDAAADATTDTDADADSTAVDGTELDIASASTFRAVLEVGSMADRSLVLDAVDLWAAPHAVAERFGANVEDSVLLTLRRGARVWAPVGRLLDEARPSELELTGAEVEDLLGPVATELAGSGIEVKWPAGVLQAVDLKPVVASDSLGADRPAGMSFDTLCELRWDASIDGEQLSPDELALLVQAKRGVVRLRGRWVRADPGKLARLQQRRKVTAGEALAAALSGDLIVDGEEIAAEVQGPLALLGERLRTVSDRGDWKPPASLRAELRPYQRDGAAWLSEMADLGLGGVLADDMGLGKTVQFLALHLARHPGPSGPTLVICPVSVLSNWAREAARFAPGTPVLRYHGTDRSLDDLPPDAIVLTTYGVARREAATLAEHQWGLVAADEAQAIKNPISRTAKALRKIPADARFALTGTPVENRLVDLWALLDWTTPGLLGPLDRFRREIAVPVERDRDPDAAESLARLVRPFLLRRRKSDPDIAPDLPPKTETDRIVPLTTEQVTLYKATVDEVMEQVEHAEGMSRRGLVLKLLTGLKQICNHPAQYLKQDGPIAGRSGKLEAVTELIDTIASEGQSVLVFTQFVAMGHLLKTHLESPGRPVQFLYGATPEAKRQEMVDRFQAGEVPVFVISVKAGGTGLNLTQATHVIHYDRWWNPAVEDQASDRAWRIGQDKPVQVHRMVCEGTVEDRISALLAEKRSIADAVVTSGEGWVSEMGDDDLRLLVALGADADGGMG